jgi:GNAT superfamily N-acetyltransferase
VHPGDESEFARRFAVHRRQPGFVLGAALHGEFLVGYAYGAPLRQSTSWWRDLTTPLPEDLTEEYQGRTFALLDLAVRAAWRRQGIGRDLHDLVLAGRPEERATVVIPPEAAAAQRAFQAWGWNKAARTRNGSEVSDVLLRSDPR